MKFHLPWKEQKHLQRNDRPRHWGRAVEKGPTASPACCLQEAEKADRDNRPKAQTTPEQSDHFRRSKSPSRKEKDLLSHTGLFFFPPLLSEFPGVVFVWPEGSLLTAEGRAGQLITSWGRHRPHELDIKTGSYCHRGN